MATVKKNTIQKATSKKVETVNSVAQTEESVDLKKQNEELKNQLNEMMANYKDMQLQMQNMLIAAQAQKATNITPDDGVAIVGCRLFTGATLSSQGGDISIPVAFREEVEISYSELREIFKNPFGFKNMFKKDTLYFKDDKDYKKFSIKKEVFLDDDSLIKMLETGNSNIVIERAKEITREKKDLTEVFALIYQIAYLIDRKKVNLDYEVRSALEKYFEVDFKTLINNLHQ